jgi:hypothetical protein
LAEEVGDRVTRQLRIGFARGEDTADLGRRVDFILTEGSDPERAKTGAKGQTIMSKGELIAHDSVQDAYVSAAHRRYLQNGFRYAIFDATIDTKTSAVCRRLNEHVIDLVETPWLVPGLHPWCRSGLRPTLDIGDREPLSEGDIADSYINTIMRTKGYRPPTLDTEAAFRPTTLTEEYAPAPS